MTEDKISYEMYRDGVYCPGSGMLFFQPDPDDADGRGICPRCEVSIGLRSNQLDDHIVLPELLNDADAPEFPVPDVSEMAEAAVASEEDSQ